MFTSKTTAKRNSRKTFEKLLKEFKKDASFKLPNTVTTLFIDTKTIISHFSVTDIWQMNTGSQLHQTMERVIESNEATSNLLDKALHAHKAPALSKHGPMLALPFGKAYAMSGNIWHHGSSYELALKGEPEHMLAICDLTENEREAAERKLHQLAGNGGKVVALAHTTLHRHISSFNDLTKKDVLVFDGFVSFSQHISPRIKALVKAAQNADVAVHLLTDDHFESALHVAKELGIATQRSQVFDSRRMHIVASEDLENVIKETRVFSHTTPQSRTRILAKFKKGEIINLV